MTDNLAPVYLDNQPLDLQDPKPKLSAVLSALGKPQTTDVKWLQFQANSAGKSVRPEEILDRTTDPSKPIYLTSAKGSAAPSTMAKPAVPVPPIANASKTPAWELKPKAEAKDFKVETKDSKEPVETKDSEEPAADESGMQDDAESGGEESVEGSDASDRSGE